VKPELSHKGCFRLGKHSNGQSWRLLVHLTSESNAASLIAASKSLKRSGATMNFYINPDLSPLEAQLAYEQRKRCRAAA